MNAHAPPVVQPLVDPFGRAIAYVRVSVTDRCDYRCVYCMSEDMIFLPKRDVLSLEELDRLCSAFVGLGARKFASPAASRWSGATSCRCSMGFPAISPRARSTK